MHTKRRPEGEFIVNGRAWVVANLVFQGVKEQAKEVGWILRCETSEGIVLFHSLVI